MQLESGNCPLSIKAEETYEEPSANNPLSISKMPSVSMDCEPVPAPASSTKSSPGPPPGRSPPPSAVPLNAAAMPPRLAPVYSHQATLAGVDNVAGSGQCNSSMGVGFLSTPLEQYRLQLYNYAIHMERLRCPQYASAGAQMLPSATAAAVAAFGYTNVAAAAAAAAAVGSRAYAPGGRGLALSLFPQRMFQSEEPKPQHSYIGLIAMAILSSVESKLVLSDIYQYILDNYPYFRTRGPGWRNSIRHNLSLNDCFVKSGRSANGKGHYWAIHPANMEDFRKGDFRRRKAQRKVRKHMGLSVDDEGADSPSPPPLAVSPPGADQLHQQHALGYLQPPPQHSFHNPALNAPPPAQFHPPTYGQSFVAAAVASAVAIPHSPRYLGPGEASPHTHAHIACSNNLSIIKETTTTTASVIANLYSQTRKRQFDVASLLAPDVDVDVAVDDTETLAAGEEAAASPSASGTTTTTTLTTKRTLITKLSVQQHHHHHHHHHLPYTKPHHTHTQLPMATTQPATMDDAEGDEDGDEQEDIDVVANDLEEGEADVENAHEEAVEQLLEDDDDHEQDESNNNNDIKSNDTGSEVQQRNFNEDTTPLRIFAAPLNFGQQMQQQYEQQNMKKHLEQQQSLDSALEPKQHQQSRLQRLIHHLPNELGHVDPRIFNRYYGTYMAAAAAQQVVTRRVGSLGFAPTSNPSQYQQHQQQQLLHHHHQQQHQKQQL